MSSTWNSPCAACKIQRRKCTEECVFAPYFPPENPQRFLYVHKVFGASNVAKLLNEVSASQREDAVKSLTYEAEARLRDPVYGCVGLISLLQNKLKHLQSELNQAKKELAAYTTVTVIPPPTPTPTLPQPPRIRQDLFPFHLEGPSSGSSSSLPLRPTDHSFPHMIQNPNTPSSPPNALTTTTTTTTLPPLAFLLQAGKFRKREPPGRGHFHRSL